MAVHYPDILAAVRTRLIADAQIDTAQVYSESHPETSRVESGASPIAVIELVSAIENDTFVDNGIDIDFQVSIYAARNDASGADDLDAMAKRVYGDNSTHGLHRWTPSVSGYGCTPIVRLSQAANHDRRVWGLVETYRTTVWES